METLRLDNPYSGEIACELPLADQRVVDATLDRAREAARAFKRSTVAERVALSERAVAAMEANVEAIASDITSMMGKPLSQSRGEVKGMAARARHMQSIAAACLADDVLPAVSGFERRIVKEPLGVVLDLPAWNYPLLTAVSAIVPAVLSGNAVVVKHSPRSPLSGKHFADAFRAAGAPDGLVQALDCDHPTSERVAGDPRVDHVVFTGSVLGGHRINAAAARRFHHVTLELGGNDAAYVAADCDLDKTVENVVDGAMYNAGQSCCAVERVYVHRAIAAQFLAKAEALIRTYVLGDPRDPATSLGPIAQPNHPAELEALVDDARTKGARVVTGGKRAQVNLHGRFFEATLLTDATHDMAIMRAESFGPILPVCIVDSDEEALLKMNDSRLGLTASVWTSDRDRAVRMAGSLEVGTVYMNRCDSLDPALPWSGVKDSGRGLSLSAMAFATLTRPKSIHFRLTW